MTESDKGDPALRFDSDYARLEQALVEAHYLGLSLRFLAANPNFRHAAITASVCELLIGWARFIGDRLQEGEPPFSEGVAPRTFPRK